jgi:hypothetical protein
MSCVFETDECEEYPRSSSELSADDEKPALQAVEDEEEKGSAEEGEPAKEELAAEEERSAFLGPVELTQLFVCGKLLQMIFFFG